MFASLLTCFLPPIVRHGLVPASDAEMELLATGPKIAAVKALRTAPGVFCCAMPRLTPCLPYPSAIVSTSLELTDAEPDAGGRRPPRQRQGIQGTAPRRPEDRQSTTMRLAEHPGAFWMDVASRALIRMTR